MKLLNNFSNSKLHDTHGFKEEVKIKFDSIKAIAGWIRTGGKNNRNIIEREEDRQRQRFKNEQYKKPRKKKKGRDSTVYSTMKQQSLSGFISLHNDLY